MKHEKILELATALNKEIKNLPGVVTSVDNILVYCKLNTLFKKLKTWEMNSRKQITNKLCEENEVAVGTKSKMVAADFLIEFKNKNTTKLDIKSSGAENVEDFCVLFDDELSDEEKECFETKMVFNMTKFENLKKENSDEKFFLDDYIVSTPAAPDLKITLV